MEQDRLIEQQRLQQQNIQQQQLRQQRIQQQHVQNQFRQKEPQFYYVTSRPYVNKPRVRFIQTTKKPDTFGIHIARLKEQIEYYSTPKPSLQNIYPNTAKSTSKPVYQFSFEAANYKQQHDALNRPHIQSEQEKFRPLPHYSVEIQQAVEVVPPTQPPPVYYQEVSSTEAPLKYYTTKRPEYKFQEINKQNDQYIVTPRPIAQFSYEATPNPIYQQVYTKQDESYFDDITKKYFTMFGKKIPSATTPLSRIEVTTARPVYIPQEQQNVQIQYAQSVGKPISLESDTLVNYVQPRPQHHPQAEYVQVNQQQKYPQVAKYVPHQTYVQPGSSLHGDIKVNYKQPRPPINPNAEIIRPANHDPNKGGSFISYQLPGDEGAHFYFLTPQLAQRRDQGVGYYYSQPNKDRIRRSNRDKGS